MVMSVVASVEKPLWFRDAITVEIAGIIPEKIQTLLISPCSADYLQSGIQCKLAFLATIRFHEVEDINDIFPMVWS